MLFNSLEFLIFFPVVTILFFMLPHKYRWLLLLAASCYFYSFFIPVYILILFFTIGIDYFAGIMIEKAEGKRKKKFLVLSIIANVGVLAVFKYFNFFIGNLNIFFNDLNVAWSLPILNIVLPIGLSFHTFQAMSYTIEVYRGKQKAEKHLGIYALYVMFYPQLVAGPIERPQNVLPQIKRHYKFDVQRTIQGLELMLWGFFKKVVIADRLAVFTDAVFNNPDASNSLTLLVGTIFFGFQIYCDFSAYSDIALGSAKIIGVDLMLNFNRPYSSKSINEFWKRWHISLSSWFRDYLYIPLGGNRVPKMRMFFNMFIVFLISGFWHGANWTFLVWGGLHGFYLIFSILTQKYRDAAYDFLRIPDKLKSAMRVVITFLLVNVTWVFFRANNLHDAVSIVTRIPYVFTEVLTKGFTISVPSFPTQDFILSILLIVLLEIVQYLKARQGIVNFQTKYKLNWGWYYAIIICIIVFGVFENRQFIYFQF